MAVRNHFQKIEGFKRVIKCKGCSVTLVNVNGNVNYCDKCWQYMSTQEVTTE